MVVGRGQASATMEVVAGVGVTGLAEAEMATLSCFTGMFLG
jgi:hypothetical protein